MPLLFTHKSTVHVWRCGGSCGPRRSAMRAVLASLLGSVALIALVLLRQPAVLVQRVSAGTGSRAAPRPPPTAQALLRRPPLPPPKRPAGASSNLAERERIDTGDTDTQHQHQQQRYAYGVEAPMELPSPPPPQPATPLSPHAVADHCTPDRRFDRYLRLRSWAATDLVEAKNWHAPEATRASMQARAAGYMCYQHRDVADDPRLGRRGCRAPFTAKRCPARQPTFPTPAGTCLCCPMVGHACPPCWGCLLPLSRRRVFGGKLYERETGGTANVFFAAERLEGEATDIVFKLRDGEVTEEERESTRLVDSIGRKCGLIRPLIAREWVAELQIITPLQPNASAAERARALREAARRPAVAAEIAHGVSADMLLRSHTFGPNKQDAQGDRARTMVHQLRQLDSRLVVQAAFFDLLFASGDRHLEHVLLRENGAMRLIDNAHTILTPRHFTRHTANSLFLPGANFHSRNRLGFPFLHCCTLKSTCPSPKPDTCPAPHTLYWPALPMDYRCHVPRGRIGRALPPQLHSCLKQLTGADVADVAKDVGVPAHSARLARFIGRARLLLERGFEGALRATELSPGYYTEADLHNGAGVPPPCCALTLDGATGNRQDDEWRCHAPASEALEDAQFAGGAHLAYASVGAHGVNGHPSAFLPTRISAGVAPSMSLAGILHSVSTTHHIVPTNRSATPHFLVHQLARHGDWHVAGRVDLMIHCAQGRDPCTPEDAFLGAEGEAVVAVAAGSGLWSAVSSDGTALVCIHPCLALHRLDSPSNSSKLAAVAVGNLSLFALTSDGFVFAAMEAAKDDVFSRTDGARIHRGSTLDAAGSVGVAEVHVPRLGPMLLVDGSLRGRKTVHVAASPHAAVAITQDGSVHTWGLGVAQTASNGGCLLKDVCLQVPLEHEPRRLAVPNHQNAVQGRASSAAISVTHLLVLDEDGRLYSAALKRVKGRSSELAALGRHATTVQSAADSSGSAPAYTLALVEAARKKSMPRISAVAAGDSFSLALVGWGYDRGDILYWGSGGSMAPGDRPVSFCKWSRRGRTRFLLISAWGQQAVAAAEDGSILMWTHGSGERPRQLPPTEPPAVTALAAGETAALLIVASFDTRDRAKLATKSTRPLLARPAPLPRPVLQRSDNVGTRQVIETRAESIAAFRDGLGHGSGADKHVPGPTPCWIPGKRAQPCPLQRKADCARWVAEVDLGFTTAANELASRVNCLPAAMLLSASGCAASSKLVEMLGVHPDMVMAPTRLRPWWAYGALSNWTGRGDVQQAVQEVSKRPSRAVLLQHASLTARAVRPANQSRAPVSLADLLPRVQPALKVIIYLCNPHQRLARIAKSARGAPSISEQISELDACHAQSPLLLCAERLAVKQRPVVDGLYNVWMRELLRALPASQLRVIRAEDFQRQPTNVALNVLRFLQVSRPAAYASTLAALAAQVRLDRAARVRKPVQKLEQFYKGHLADLVQLMDGDQRFQWSR